ncbi:MAG: 1-deoxy-D-xylulose-5-phosphate reductoisomerase [Ruminococcaceae bacterium]|nr:1-deoxy-D-xylulose-5-phosphate reductoisomerase [Oscillospiraceae bacterium]
MRYVTILGSTGSIGTQALDVIESTPGLSVEAISGHSNISLLEAQARKFLPEYVCTTDETKYSDLKTRLSDTSCRVLCGEEGILNVASLPKSDTVITGIVGIAGLKPTLAAINSKKRIGLANKETLVTAGDIVKEACRKTGSEIIPVDSEHSAIFQCMEKRADAKENVKRILLTCSGGPFFGRSLNELKNVTKSDALKHPNWDMGAKITIDSASLMNKGLEVIEAFHLFDVPFENIKVLVHRQSIVHSMVEFCDNAVLAQLGAPDMKLPIQYAITYPNRLPMTGNELDLLTCGNLTFEEPDRETFRCLDLAYKAGKTGHTMPCVLNGANEEAVFLFLSGKIGFLDIAETVEAAMQAHKIIENPTLSDIYDCDKWAREFVKSKI